MSNPVLSTHDFSKQLKLTVDASNVRIEAALFQKHSGKVDESFLIFLRKLKNVNKTYFIIEKDALLCC